MNESQIRQLVQQEMAKSAQVNRFNLTNTSRHQHNRNDITPINQNDINPGNSVTGRITFSQATVYNIGVNFNPTSILIHGNVTGPGSERYITIGNAQIGPSLYLQPATTTSVKPGGLPQTIIQCSTYFGNDGGAFHTVNDEGHVVDVEYPLGTIHARATIISVSSNGVLLQVDNLEAGWNMNLNFTIT